jgi:hypothetical protein
MVRWLIPFTFTAIVALALLAFPDEAGAVDNDDADAIVHEVGCGGALDLAMVLPGLDPAGSQTVDPPPDARREPRDPAEPAVQLVAEPAPEASVPWTWFALAGAIGVVGVAGIAFALRPALARR